MSNPTGETLAPLESIVKALREAIAINGPITMSSNLHAAAYHLEKVLSSRPATSVEEIKVMARAIQHASRADWYERGSVIIARLENPMECAKAAHQAMIAMTASPTPAPIATPHPTPAPVGEEVVERMARAIFDTYAASPIAASWAKDMKWCDAKRMAKNSAAYAAVINLASDEARAAIAALTPDAKEK